MHVGRSSSPPLTPPWEGGEPTPPLAKGRSGGVKDLRRAPLVTTPRIRIFRALNTFGSIVMRDFDGDGKADILWYHTPTGTVAVWLMDGPQRQSGGVPGVVADLGWQIQ